MRIVVCIKQVPDMYSARSITAEGLLDRSGDVVLNEIDENALATSVNLLESLDKLAAGTGDEPHEIIALTAGPPRAVTALRRALQLGANRAVHVLDTKFTGLDAPGTAAVLARAIDRIHQETPVDLVVTAMASMDGLTTLVPVLLAAELDWPTLTRAVGVITDGTQISITRDGQVSQPLSAKLPAVVTVTDRAPRPMLPNMKAIAAARTTEVELWTAADLGYGDVSAELAPRIEVVHAARRVKSGPREVFHDDGTGGKVLAEHLAAVLHGSAQQDEGSVVLSAPDDAPRVAVVISQEDASRLSAEGQALVRAGVGLANQRSSGLRVLVVLPDTDSAAGSLGEHLASFGVSQWETVPADEELISGLADRLRQDPDPQVVLFSSTFDQTELAARVAHQLDAAVVTAVQELDWSEPALIMEKQVLAGSWQTRVRQLAPRAVLTVRTVSRPEADAQDTSSEHLSIAHTVIAGGRGTGGDFSPVRELAEVLGGAVGATRDAVDEGWIHHDAMIGQTGATVLPLLYVGAGISGAVHHLGGMQGAQHIVVVNNDPEAPIMQFADFAVIGDLAEILPAAAAHLRELLPPPPQ